MDLVHLNQKEKYLEEVPQWLKDYRACLTDASDYCKQGSQNADFRFHYMVELFTLNMAEFRFTEASEGEKISRYETIKLNDIIIGDRNDTGNNAEMWAERNPNLHLVGAYIHCDEPDGTVHLHCDYIPVAECSGGMRIQNSLDKALRQQGLQSTSIRLHKWLGRHKNVMPLCLSVKN